MLKRKEVWRGRCYNLVHLQLCFAPIFRSCPCSRWCLLLLTLEGGFASGACPVSLSKCTGCLLSPTHLRLLSDSSAQRLRMSPFALPSFATGATKSKACCQRNLIQERAVGCWWYSQGHRNTQASRDIRFSRDSALLARAGKSKPVPMHPQKSGAAGPLSFPKFWDSHWDDLTILLLSARVHSLGRFCFFKQNHVFSKS